MEPVRKNLANCTPREFLKQTNLLKKSLMRWIEVTGISEIRKRLPKLTGLETDLAKKDAIKKQAVQNMSDILDKALEEFPEETLSILAIACFVDPSDVDSKPMSYYLGSVAEMISDEDVLSFFISLNRLGQLNTLTLSKA